jgi:hypothetical protein
MMISGVLSGAVATRDDPGGLVRRLLPRKAANSSFGPFLSTDYAKRGLAKASVQAAQPRGKYVAGVMPGEYAIAPLHIL